MDENIKNFNLISFDALPEATEEERWLVEGLWPSEAVGLVVAPPKFFKTWLVLDAAVAIASGTKCLGIFQTRQGAVVYVPGEGRPAKLRSRLTAIMEERSASAPLPLHILDFADRPRLNNPDHQRRLLKTLAAVKPALVIFDPFRRLYDGDENSSQATAEVLNFLGDIQQKVGCAIMLVHHSRKQDFEREMSGSSIRGSSDLFSWGESFLFLSRPHGKSGSVFPDGVSWLSCQHRDEESYIRLPVALKLRGNSAVLAEYLEDKPPRNPSPREPSLREKIIDVVTAVPGETVAAIAKRVQKRKQDCAKEVATLVDAGIFIKGKRGRLSVARPKVGEVN